MPITGGAFGHSEQNQGNNDNVGGPKAREVSQTSRRYTGHTVALETPQQEAREGMGFSSEHVSQQERIARIKQEQRRQWLSDPFEQPLNANQILTVAPIPRRPLLPPAIITSQSTSTETPQDQHPPVIMRNIERPRSALHAGDFTHRQVSQHTPDTPRPQSRTQRHEWISTSPTTPWYTASSRQSTPLPRIQTQHERYATLDGIETPRHRAASYSASSSGYVWRPPTSPLVLQSNSNDPEPQDDSHNPRSISPDKTYRRRTFSPGSLQTFGPLQRLQNFHEPYGFSPAPFRRERILPAQAHQPRRSFSSLNNASESGEFSTPSARSRRPSMSEHSPLQHAPLVGHYEESILRGRMSTLPSRPLDFIAQVGVLGKGKCKASLKCPRHVTIPFPAVFYDYRHNRDSLSPLADGPSPYVGQIDLENNIKLDRSVNRLRRQQSPESDGGSNMDSNVEDSRHGMTTRRHRHRQQRRPPKGGYRIPQQGQLQILIKNPNKTAVKLFLVPYDLTGMTSGHKTFIRQRSYSWGPIIDMPTSARKNLGTERPEAALSSGDDPKERPVLRYLIHLHICCPSRGRFYLYKNIRVVFANRVPDSKEKLRVETQLPEPRFSVYKEDLPPSTTAGVQQPPNLANIARPLLSVSQAGIFGGYVQHNYPLGPPSSVYHSSGQSADRQVLLNFDFPGLPEVAQRANMDAIRAGSLEHRVSPTSTHSAVTDSAMSWRATSPKQGWQSPLSPFPDGSGRRFVMGERDGSTEPTPRSGPRGLLSLQLRDLLADHSKPQNPP